MTVVTTTSAYAAVPWVVRSSEKLSINIWGRQIKLPHQRFGAFDSSPVIAETHRWLPVSAVLIHLFWYVTSLLQFRIMNLLHSNFSGVLKAGWNNGLYPILITLLSDHNLTTYWILITHNSLSLPYIGLHYSRQPRSIPWLLMPWHSLFRAHFLSLA